MQDAKTSGHLAAIVNFRFEVNALAGTFVGWTRRATADNCCCYYLGCGRHCRWGWYTEPCPPRALGSVSRTADPMCCQRQQVGTRSEEVVEGGLELDQVHRLLVAFDRTRALPRHFHGQRGFVQRQPYACLHRPCAQPPPPSSSLSILCGFP